MTPSLYWQSDEPEPYLLWASLAPLSPHAHSLRAIRRASNVVKHSAIVANRHCCPGGSPGRAIATFARYGRWSSLARWQCRRLGIDQSQNSTCETLNRSDVGWEKSLCVWRFLEKRVKTVKFQFGREETHWLKRRWDLFQLRNKHLMSFFSVVSEEKRPNTSSSTVRSTLWLERCWSCSRWCRNIASKPLGLVLRRRRNALRTRTPRCW